MGLECRRSRLDRDLLGAAEAMDTCRCVRGGLGHAKALRRRYVDPLSFQGRSSTYFPLGWNKRMSYCIAFSTDGATDVTRRYVRNVYKHGKDRTRAPEGCLAHIINEIRDLRRKDMSKDARHPIVGQDIAEEKELNKYVVNALAAEVTNLLPGRPEAPPAQQLSQDQKLPAGRQSGSPEWIRERGEDGQESSRDGR